MKRSILLLAFVVLAFVGCQRKGITPVSFTDVHVEDTFWRQRLDTLRNKTIRYAFERSDRAGYVRNFAIAAGLMEGRFQSGQPFDDADLFKVIEGAAYLLKVEPDPELEQYVDSIIDIVVAAQEPDGYLFTNRTINNPLHPWCGKERWETDWNLSHETFNAGELYEAAVAYYDATGKRKMLDAAIKNADLVCKDFNWDGIVMAPGHAVIEMALVRLYEATGDKKYLDEARFFLDCRGHREFDPTSDDLRVNGKYWQDHLPATKQREAVGHAVRALYFYSGMADIALHQGDKEYLATADSIWENIVSKKFYITGGLGARAHNEAFGENYELPNGSAYCETCASIANAMFNLRMFRLHGDSKYIDVLERSLYNTVLCGISITGDSYFYPNPLETGQGGQLRSAWFGCSCCPTNVCRIIPSVPGYVYATEGNRIYANLYMSSRSEIELGGKQVVLRQRTEYPWEGSIEFEVEQPGRGFELALRIPGWARGEAVPSDLYTYTDPSADEAKIYVNGEEISFSTEKGYALISRKWQAGDKVRLELPMRVRQVRTHSAVVGNRGLLSVERGPIVYCAEGTDNGGRVADLSLQADAKFRVVSDSLSIGGAYTLRGEGLRYAIKEDNSSVESLPSEITFIPYYARSYKGATEMKVFLPESGEDILSLLESERRTIDKVIIGNHPSEQEHNLKGEHTRCDSGMGWRDAVDGGWFSYDLKCDREAEQELVLTFHSTDDGNRTFDILINGEKIATRTLRRETFDALIDTAYPIPAHLLRGGKLTVKFDAHDGNLAGGIFGCKVRKVER